MDYLRKTIYETRSHLSRYQVVEEVYLGRPSRLLYSGNLDSTQSGIALDNLDKPLFEYNQLLFQLVTIVRPKNILIIGGGAYTLPSYLVKKYSKLVIDVVEPDEKLDALARRFFNLKGGFNIIHNYGLNYLKNNAKKYDLIIVDAYADQHVPEEVISKKFAKLAAKSLESGGLIAANVISTLTADSVVASLHKSYARYFKYVKVFPTDNDNTPNYTHNLIYVGSNQPIKVDLKYPPIKPADLSWL